MGLGTPSEFWRQTPRLFTLAVAARGKALDREHNERAWLAFHIAVLPHQKRPVRLTDLMVKRPDGAPEPGRQTVAEMDVVMRKWRVVMADVTAKAKPRPPRPSIQTRARRTNGR